MVHNQEIYDNADEFERRVGPLLEQIQEICDELNVPYYAQYAISSSAIASGEAVRIMTSARARESGWVPMIFALYKLLYDNPGIFGDVMSFVMSKIIEQGLEEETEQGFETKLQSLLEKFQKEANEFTEKSEKKNVEEDIEEVPKVFDDFLDTLLGK